MALEIKHAIAEINFVVVHSHVRQEPADLAAAAVYIFRFDRKRIVELRDVGQSVPEQSVKKNRMF